MACFDFLAGSPNNPDAVLFVPRAITPDGDYVYGVTTQPKVQVFTWPGLVYDSTYAAPGMASGVDVTLDDSGNVYHSENTSGTTCTVFKNGVSLTSVTLASGAFGGGLAWAGGSLWLTFSTFGGGGTGRLYEVDPSTGTTTAVHTLAGGQLSAGPYAATDGALWYRNLSGTAYRYDGSVASATLATVAHFVPRPSGVMLTWKSSSPTGWIDLDTALVSSAAACNPTTVAGAFGPVRSSFANPDLTDVCLIDNLNDIYRAEVVAAGNPWTVGRVRWGSTTGDWH